ncbi:inositol monophosphatase family protein [Tundrisphaera lichenicola]|uniref:inositol monophosphatase family protein n=1 Tax=Tundrisphaera lichenicola TaxID=2029860 RepID=UPI003EBD6160
MSGSYREYRTVAERAAVEAGRILLDSYGKVSAREKAPGDLVTEADSASQRRIAQILAEAFPDHTLLAEEDGVVPDPDNLWRWVVDPLDGTVNFAHNFPFWCVSIALEHAGELVVGVIHNPLTGQTFAGSKGEGAEVDGRSLRVSKATGLHESLISTGWPTPFESDADRTIEHARRMSTGTHSIRRTGSTALNLAYVASGAFDVFYATSIHPWDVAAGVVLVREAGGTVTLLDGLSYDMYRRELLASNGNVHASAVEALRTAGLDPQ